MRTLFISSVMFAILVLMSGCDMFLEGSKGDLTLTLRNSYKLDTHLWINDETIGPSNKVSPGGKRTVYKSYIDEEGNPQFPEDTKLSYVVYAGRNGEMLTSTTFEIDTNVSNNLSCTFNGTSLSVSY